MCCEQGLKKIGKGLKRIEEGLKRIEQGLKMIRQMMAAGGQNRNHGSENQEKFTAAALSNNGKEEMSNSAQVDLDQLAEKVVSRIESTWMHTIDCKLLALERRINATIEEKFQSLEGRLSALEVKIDK